MNNIEYESLKKKVDKEIKDGGYPYDDLSLLLQYRREHNIFEVGDFMIDSLIGNGVTQYHEGYKHMEDHYVKAFLKHATDAEIKLGRRID